MRICLLPHISFLTSMAFLLPQASLLRMSFLELPQPSCLLMTLTHPFQPHFCLMVTVPALANAAPEIESTPAMVMALKAFAAAATTKGRLGFAELIGLSV